MLHTTQPKIFILQIKAESPLKITNFPPLLKRIMKKLFNICVNLYIYQNQR